MAISAAQLSRLSELLEQALTLSPAERQAWLAALPPQDRPLEAALRDMFDAQGKPQSFMEAMPRVAPGLSAEAGEPQPGDTVGTYRLVRLVGRGGMGSVWLAERADGALQRRVAIKLPHLAWGAGLAERMRRERDIGARLEHPHIARLYDAGVDHRGHPFLAFEFIDGVAIDLWCRSRQLNVRARLKLFLQVAQAVAYAHARLVVHRDLKPSNVLVSADGQVHLLDFGIAKLLHEGPDDASATQRLGAAMTPHYASPEQLCGEPVTVASDVYSLGVMLYELLTGERPYASDRTGLAAWQQMQQQAAPPASQKMADRAQARALRGDIDAILAKALQRQPDQRYATVDALADDIQRHLAGEPVRARPDTPAYRLRAMARRSHAGLALGAAAVTAVALAAGLALNQTQRANEAAARAGAVKDFVLDTFRVDAAGDSASLDPHGAPREFLLKRGARLIDARFDGQPSLQAELHGVVSNLFDEMANFELAELHAARRLEVLAHSGASTTDKAVAAMAVSQALLKLGRAAQAEEPAAQAIGWAQGDARLAVLARLQLAASLAAQSKAEALGRELDTVDAELARHLPTASIERAMALGARAGLASLQGQGAEAIEHAQHAVAVAAGVEGAASPRVLNLRWNLWRLLMEFRQVDQARELGAAIVADLRQLGGPQDGTAAFAEIYTTAFLFANDPDHRLSFDAAEAIVLADREIVRQHGCRGIADADAWSDYLLGGLYAAWHDFDRAEPLLSQSLARIAPLGDELTLIPYASRVLAWTWIVRGDHARGDAVLQAQLGLMARRASPMAPRVRATLALSQSMQGRHREALDMLGTLLAGPRPAAAGAAADDAPDAAAPEIALVRAEVLLGSAGERGERPGRRGRGPARRSVVRCRPSRRRAGRAGRVPRPGDAVALASQPLPGTDAGGPGPVRAGRPGAPAGPFTGPTIARGAAIPVGGQPLLQTTPGEAGGGARHGLVGPGRPEMTAMPRLKSRLKAALAAACLLSIPVAHAQEASADALFLSSGDVPVLTPTHLRQAVRDIPASVTILSAETLALYGFQGLAESMRLVAGASPDRLAGANYALPILRQRAVGPIRVTLLVDGIEVGGTVLSEDDDWNDLPVALGDIERIEVTTGAGAAGYGRAAKVAVVNFVTKHPADVERAYASVSLGSFESVRTMVRGGWTLGPAALRLTMQHREREAIDDRRAFTPGDDALTVDRVTLRSSLPLAEGSSLAFDAAYLSLEYAGEPRATRPLGQRDLRNGYASLLWTQSLGPSNELSLRLDQWANTSREFPLGCAPEADCPPDEINVERRSKFELQDVHLLSDEVRITGGLGLRRALIRERTQNVDRWSANYRRTFAGIDWMPLPAWSFGAGWSADEADGANHDRVWHVGANWHVSDQQTLRFAFSDGDWASDQTLRLGINGALVAEERMRSTELGYRLDAPDLGASVNGRLFWSKVEGRLWRPKQDGFEAAHGEFYGADLRAAGELSDRWSGFVSATVVTEGDNSGRSEGHRPRPWLGAAGVAVKLGDGWRASFAYYAASHALSSTQVAGRTALTAMRDFRWYGGRWQLVLNARMADHLRAREPDSDRTPHTATAWTYFASLYASF